MAERNIRYTNAAQWMSSFNGILLVRGSPSAGHRGLEAVKQLVQLLSLERREERQHDFTTFLCKDKRYREDAMATGKILYLQEGKVSIW